MYSSVHTFPVRNKRVKKVGKRSPLSDSQHRWLERGLTQAGGKLPLFDERGQRYSEKTIHSCLSKGWAELWFKNPINPSWLVCRLTEKGRKVLRVSE